jgi:hypothetical protein
MRKRGHQKKMTEKDRVEILKLRKKGLFHYQIEEITGWSAGAISRVCVRSEKGEGVVKEGMFDVNSFKMF